MQPDNGENSRNRGLMERTTIVTPVTIQGTMANLGIEISDTTVGNILREHGIEPAPERGLRTSWKTFLQAHWDSIAAVDFTTIEV